MKKFLNTMLVTAAVVAASTTAYAATSGAKVAQGAYIGASAGAANTNVKYNRYASGNDTSTSTTIASKEVETVNSNAGKTAGIFGLIAGYNFQSGSVVFGGEIYGGFDSTKVSVYDDTASGYSTERAAIGSVTVKRTNFMGFAPRLGFMVAPNTLMYARLGAEFGKWTATSTPNAATLANGNAFTSTADSSAEKAVNKSSKGGVSFAPGLGMEVYMGKAFLRAQYSYLFGPKVTVVQNMKDYVAGTYNGEFANHTMKMTQHKVELAVGYKF
jgi:hypothetical protein